MRAAPPLEVTLPSGTFVAVFSDLPFNVAYTCCVEAGFVDSRDNASSCATGMTEEGGISIPNHLRVTRMYP